MTPLSKTVTRTSVWMLAFAGVLMTPTLSHGQASNALQTTLGLQTIGMNLAYVEKQLGPAMRSGYGEHEFDVEGCVFTLTTDAQGRGITRVDIKTSAKCPLTMGQLLSTQDRTPVNGLTFKEVEAIAGNWHYMANCLYMCGNAAPSNVYYWLPGSNSNGNIEVAFGRSLDDEEISPARANMRDKLMEQFSEDYVLNAQFNCLPNQANRTMAEAVRPYKIDRVVFGQAPIDAPLGIGCSESQLTASAQTNEPAAVSAQDDDLQMRQYIAQVMEQIKKDPNGFVKSCTKAEASIRMEYGGEDERTATRYAQESCNAQLQDFKQCAKQGGEAAIVCIRDAIGTEGDI